MKKITDLKYFKVKMYIYMLNVAGDNNYNKTKYENKLSFFNLKKNNDFLMSN